MLPMEWQGDDLFEEDFDGLVSVLNAEAPAVTDDDGEAGEVNEADIDAPPPVPTREALSKQRARIVLAEENLEGNVLTSVIADGYKYIRANEGNPRGLATEEMYALGPDPGEQNNLVGKDGRGPD